MDEAARRKAEEIDRAWALARPVEPPKNGRGTINWTAWRPGLLERLSAEQNHRCCYCGCRMNEADQKDPLDLQRATFEHVVPLTKLTPEIDTEDNLVAACRLCNNSHRNPHDPLWRRGGRGA